MPSHRATRFLFAFLVVVTVVLLPGPLTQAFGQPEEGMVYYNPIRIDTPLMNLDTSTDSAFWKSVVNSNNDSVFNIAPGFRIDNELSDGASSMPEYLKHGTKFKHKSDDETYGVYYRYEFEYILDVLTVKRDIYASCVADLHNDKHWNWERHEETKTAYPVAYLNSSNGHLIVHSSEGRNSDMTDTYGEHDFVQVDRSGGLRFGASAQVCTCGGSSVTNISIMLADRVGPKVKSIYAWRLREDAMQRYANYRLDDTFYINMTFDEPIRFAGDAAMSLESAPKLKLLLRRIGDNIQETGITVEAELISLDEYTLTFRYTVPSTLTKDNGQVIAANHYIYAIAPYGEQDSWIRSGKEFDLKIYANGTTFSRKVESLIVDLAGNPVQTNGTVTPNSPIYIDAVAPTVRDTGSRIELVRPSHLKSRGNNSDVYATMGEKIGFFVYFSEEMFYVRLSDRRCELPTMEYKENSKVVGYDMRVFYRVGDNKVVPRLLAELNVLSGGKPVIAAAKYITTIQDGNNGPRISKVYFEAENPFEPNMVMNKYGGDAELPIGINHVYMDTSETTGQDLWAFGDARGNLFDMGEVRLVDAPDGSRVMPAQQLWLDTSSPTATTTVSQSPAESGKYDPILYPGSDDFPVIFSFPVTIADTVKGTETPSATNGYIGFFMWKDNGKDGSGREVSFPFEWTVTQSAAQPEDTAYQPGQTDQYCRFGQVDSGNYIHIRILKDVEYNMGDSQIVVYPLDWAQNVGEVPFTLNLTVDEVGPRFISNGCITDYKGTNQGRIVTSITVRDASEIAGVQYQWTDWNTDPVHVDWEDVSVSDYVYSSDPRVKTFVLQNAGLRTDELHQYSLHVQATDELGNSSKTKYDLQLDLSLPTYNLELVTEPSSLEGQHSAKVYLTDSGDTPPAGATKNLWVLVKRPGLYDPGEQGYWIRRYTYGELRRTVDDAIHAIDILKTDEGWQVTTQTRGESLVWVGPELTDYAWLPGYKYEDGAMGDGEKKALSDMLTRHYGPVEVTIIAQAGKYPYSGDYLLDKELYSKSTFTFNMASGSMIEDLIHYIEVWPDSKTPVNNSSYYVNEDVTGSSMPLQPSVPRTLDGAIFHVKVRNQKSFQAYGLSDIDFESEDTRFSLFKTGEGASDTPLFTSPLSPVGTQSIVIPPGVETGHGSYQVVVSVKSKSTGYIDRKVYDSIFIDKREIKNYGVLKVMSTGNYQPDPPYGDNYRSDKLITEFSVSAGNRPTEIWASENPNALQSVRFTCDIPSLQFGDRTDNTAFLRVWNVTTKDRIGLNDYSWISIPWKFDMVDESIVPGELEYTIWSLGPNESLWTYIATNITTRLREGFLYKSRYHAAVIPVKPGDNVIKYQIQTTTGIATPEQTLIIHVGSVLPEIKMDLSPPKSSGTTNGDVTCRLSSVSSAIDPPETLRIGMAFEYGESGDAIDALREEFATAKEDGSHSITITKNGDYFFYVVDKYQDYGFQKVVVDYIDKEKPTLGVEDLSDEDGNANTFSLKASVADALGSDKCQIHLKFDNAYSSVLGVKEGTTFEIPIVNSGGSWQETQVSQSGVYAVSAAEGSGGARVYTISGAFKHDPKTDPSAVADRTITLYAVDGAGNTSDEKSVTIGSAANEPAKYVSGELSGGGFSATFNKPVILVSPNESTLTPTYQMTKSALPYFTNGTYLAKFAEIFGVQGGDQIVVDQYTALYNCAVTISETAPTNKNVTVLLNTAFNLAVQLELPGSVEGGTIVPTLDGVGNVVGATVTMSRNGSFSYTLRPKDVAFEPVTRTISVNNIDKTPPSVELAWTYSDVVIEGLTAGDITASLISDEDLMPREGTATTHTFTLNDQEPYVFHYSDIAGNEGRITATPSATIVAKDAIPDATPPDYELSIYTSEGGVLTKAGGYTKAEYDALYAVEADREGAFPLFSGLLDLRFDVFDVNQTSASIKNQPEGISVRGNMVTVTQNGNYVIVITDSANNTTEVPICISGADNTPPTGTITYVNVPEFGVRGYLTVTDDRTPDKITVKNTAGVMLDTTAGPYFGKYYHEFLDNESFTFYFTDEAGNEGSAVAVVTTLDTTSPAGTIVQWVPYFIGKDGVEQKGTLSDKPTNSDVSVFIRLNKAVRPIVPSIVDAIGDLAHISISQAADSATVVFRQNAKVRLYFTALNTRSGFMELNVNIIDKVAPVITAHLNEADSTNEVKRYQFTSNEDVFFEDVDSPKASELDEDGNPVSVAGRSFTKDFDLNGTYLFRFTDLAGNSTVKQVTVSGIDRERPSISVKGLPATKEEVAAYNQSHDPDVEHQVSRWSVGIQVSMSEEGWISFLGKQYEVDAGKPVTLTINNNGTYEVVATDLVGLSTAYRFRIDCIDKLPPQVVVPGGSLLVREGTTAAELAQQAKAQITVIDNRDDSNPGIEITRNLTLTELDVPGTYSIGVTASDSAGNSKQYEVSVRVYDKDMAEIRANGILALPNETVFVDGNGSRVVNVTVGNLPEGVGGLSEPYKTYWKPGLNTPGQMKNGTEFEGSFTGPKDGFYTIYVVTQSRQSLRTYIYLQK